MSKLQLFQERFQRLLETDPSYEDIVLVPLILTYEAVKYLFITLAPIVLALILVFTPFASGQPEPVMFVTVASAERAQNALISTNYAQQKIKVLEAASGSYFKKYILRPVPTYVLARMCELRGINDISVDDRDGMITRLVNS